MPTPFLAMRYKTGVTPQVQRYVTGAAATQGVTFGALETGGSNVDQANQRVIRFLGYETFVAVVGTSIYRSTDAGASWTAVLTDADLGGTVTKSGIHLVYVSGDPTLTIMARSGIGTYWLFTSTDGVTWTKTGSFALTDQTTSFHAVTEWRGALYFTAGLGGSARMYIANPGALTVSEVTLPSMAGSTNDAAICVFNDRLFIGYTDTGTGRWALYELVAGAMTFRTYVGTNITSFGNSNRKSGLWAYGSSMYALFVTDNPLLWNCFEISSTLTTTDITGTVVPFASPTANTRVGVITDGSVSPGTVPPEIYAYVSVDGAPGTLLNLFEWNGPATPLTSLGSGGDVGQALPFGVQAGGSVFWTSGQRHIERVSATPVTGGVSFGFRIYSPNPSVDAVSVRWIYGNNVDEYPHTPYATLTNPSAGSISGGNTITGLDAADNGATLFTVTWLAQTDGFASGDYAKTTPNIFS